MASGMDDFGDFSSAFPAASISGVGPNGISSGTVENSQKTSDTMEFFTNFSLPTVAKTGETGSMILPQSTDSIPFDAFALCPLDSDGEMPNFADFGQFDMSIADFTIPNPGTVDVSNGILEIPPLPDDLQFASSSSMETGIAENRETNRPSTSESEFINPSSLGATLPSESSSDQSSPLAATLDSIQSSRESGISMVPSSTAATTTAGPGPGPLRAKDSSGSRAAVQDDGRTTQDPLEQDDEFGDFESSFHQPTAITSLGQNSNAVEVVTESRTSNEKENFVTFDAFAGTQGTSEEGDWSSGFGNFVSMSSSQQQDSMPGAQDRSSDDLGALGGVSIAQGFSADFNAFQQTTQTGSSGFKVSSTNSEPTSREGRDFDAAPEKRDAISTLASRNETSLFSTSNNTPISNIPPTNTDTGSNLQDDAGYGNCGAFASGSDTAEFSGFAKFESSSTEASQISGKNKQEDSEFGAFSSSGDDFGSFSGGGTVGAASSSFSPTPAPPPAAVRINYVKASGGVLVVCFSASDGAIDSPPQLTLGSLDKHLKLTGSPAAGGTESVWQSVQKSVDFTVPLYKWNKSYMQQRYYGSLRIDPLLLQRPGALPVFASGLEPLAVPLGSQSAAEDLMESFGFESELEPQGEAASEGRSTFRQDSEESAAPALLDLSLPPTPSAETQKDSFTLTSDLLGLDLNPQRKLTSIEELLINERLVVNRSTWMDSQLLELEARGAGEREGPAASQQSSTSSTSQPSTPALPRRQPSLEQQLLNLGLDASKTTSLYQNLVSEQKELSFSSQSVLGRLPDLSFMLSDVLVQTHYKK